MLIFFSRLFCSTSSSQRRGERRRSSICNRFYLRQLEGVSQILFYLRQEKGVSQIWFYLRQQEGLTNVACLPCCHMQNMQNIQNKQNMQNMQNIQNKQNMQIMQHLILDKKVSYKIWQVFLAATQLCLIVIFLAYFG